MPMEKLRRNETANSSTNSKNFVQPEDVAKSEELRLKDKTVVPGDSGVEGGRNFY